MLNEEKCGANTMTTARSLPSPASRSASRAFRVCCQAVPSFPPSSCIENSNTDSRPLNRFDEMLYVFEWCFRKDPMPKVEDVPRQGFTFPKNLAGFPLHDFRG